MKNDNKHIPAGYKPSPLGPIPEDWEVKRLGEVSTIKGGYAFDSNKMSEDIRKYQIVKMGNLYDGKLDLSRCPSYLDSIDESEKDYLLKEGDIIITLTGTVGKRDYGNAVLIQKETNLLLNQRNAKIVSDILDNKYLFYVIKSERFLYQFFYSSKGGTGSQTNVGIPDLENIRIIVPPFKEQKCISNIGALWDTAIAKQTALIEQLTLRKRGLMQQLLTGKKRLKGFNGAWKDVRLGEVCDLTKGEQVNSETLTETGLFPVINGGITPSGYKDGYNTEANTITISEGGNSCGFVNLIKTKFWSGGHCYTISNVINFDLNYLYYSLKFAEPHIMNLRVGSGLPNIQLGPLQKFTLLMPQFEEQKAIAAILEQADKEIELAQNKLANLRQQKKGLMQVLLTGKKRIINH